MALSAFAGERRAAGETGTTRSTALSSKPAACRCCGRMTGTDKRTDGRTHDRYIDPAPHTMRVVPTTIGYNQLHIQSKTVTAAITYY